MASLTTENQIFLLSGPGPFGRNWRRAIQRAGVASSRVYYEEFSW